jgi:hypothetical protein
MHFEFSAAFSHKKKTGLRQPSSKNGAGISKSVVTIVSPVFCISSAKQPLALPLAGGRAMEVPAAIAQYLRGYQLDGVRFLSTRVALAF